MCGRFTLVADVGIVQDAFGLVEGSGAAELTPRYNIAPTQPVAVITANAQGQRQLEYFHWGLIPSWAKDAKIANSLINARAETVAEKPAFRSALKKRRCLIPADGFYEWKREGKTKTPMYIQLKNGEPFALAGLYEFWKPADSDKVVASCTIITTTPNTLMEKIHDRMPVIIKPESYDSWLAGEATPVPQALSMLKPFAASQMKARPVSTLVNNARVESPDCIKPV